jgi:hypothetical protein
LTCSGPLVTGLRLPPSACPRAAGMPILAEQQCPVYPVPDRQWVDAKVPVPITAGIAASFFRRPIAKRSTHWSAISRIPGHGSWGGAAISGSTHYPIALVWAEISRSLFCRSHIVGGEYLVSLSANACYDPDGTFGLLRSGRTRRHWTTFLLN